MKNAGFIKVDIRNGEVTMEVVVRNLFRIQEDGMVWGLLKKDAFTAIPLGEIKMHSGQGEASLCFPGENVQNTGCSIDDFVGIGIGFGKQGYVASCWDDAYAVKIAQGNYESYQDEQIKANEIRDSATQLEQENPAIFLEADKKEELETDIPEEAEIQECDEIFTDGKPEAEECSEKAEVLEAVSQDEETVPEEDFQAQENLQEMVPLEIAYQKIELSQLRELPGRSLHYSSNGFLIHGFFNFGFLILKTEAAGDETKVWLGVPGIFEKPERAMALVFGFPAFEEIPQEMTSVKMNEKRVYRHREENREPKTGVFGCWFVPL